MQITQTNFADGPHPLPRMPPWVTSVCAETLEDVAFLSGAALATLHRVVRRADVSNSFLRDRLSLTASEACVRLSGRLERTGDQPGPAGAIYLQWQRAAARPISVATLHKALPAATAEQIAAWLDTGRGAPVVRATALLETVLSTHPREEAMALILADAVLAQSLGWKYVLPLLAVELKSRDLRMQGADLQLACHKALVASIGATLPIAADLTRRAAHLQAVIPKLRAKGATDAVALFLTKDSLSPSVALADPTTGVGMSDRAARRLCDRLVALGGPRIDRARHVPALQGLRW